VGNKFAGLGAYYYGQGAGMGLFASGLGDYMAGQGRLLEGRLFAMRTKLGASTGLGSDNNYREIRLKTQQLENDLRETMPEMTPMEYTMAKNFLRSLEFEAQHPMATSFPVARIADAR
jgi:hypothetical protein